ncbi:hypothetical protein BESB_038350 [Besnoitia besnoiti]|uniref:SRS domain-containing protein n=1 Tax=Besnoitia besnoiti TaxID=94643 RepID=A0A2A9MNE5_BESBE|nr:hypothetical protein BESB_038350 [Besnoitia besnoiti]PFH37377.1 hypothetical protein BESB_038350 [Besnoitia besnoiti]
MKAGQLRAVAWVEVVLCLLAGRSMCFAQEPVKVVDGETCKGGSLAWSLGQEDETLVFECRDPVALLDPSDPRYVFGEKTPSESVLLDERIRKATLTLNKPANNAYTLTVPEKPKTDIKVVYICRKNNVAGVGGVSPASSLDSFPKDLDKCTITITVVGKPDNTEDNKHPLPPALEDQKDDPALSDKTYSCSDVHDTNITVSAPNTNLKLQCPSSLIFEPTKAAEVFDDEDGECKTAKALSVLVPEAERRDESGVLTLKIPRLPAGSKNTALCYRCRTASAGSQRETEQGCAFRISVVSAESSASIASGLTSSGAIFIYIVGAALGDVKHFLH